MEEGNNTGVCRGLVVGNKGQNIQGGVYPALERGECKILSFDHNCNAPEVIAFANTLVNTVIEVDRQWSKK